MPVPEPQIQETEPVKPADERRPQKLQVVTTESQRAAIEHMITLWQCMRGRPRKITPEARGEAFAELASAWVDAKSELFQGKP